METKHPLLKSKGNKPRKGKVVKCLVCGKDIYVQPCHIGTKKYCSYKCLYTSRPKPDSKKTVVCKNCGKEFKEYRSYISIRGRTFCGVRCEKEWITREANLNKDGSIPSTKTAKKRQIKKRKPGNGMRTADNLFSLYIRKRDGKCLRCGKTESLQCSHIFPRTYKSLRYDDENAITMCVGCHIYWWHKSPAEASYWLDKTFPGRYETILEKLKKPKEKLDFEKIKEEIRNKMEALDEN